MDKLSVTLFNYFQYNKFNIVKKTNKQYLTIKLNFNNNLFKMLVFQSYLKYIKDLTLLIENSVKKIPPTNPLKFTLKIVKKSDGC